MKLVVADDNRQILDGIVEGIDWREIGVDEVFPAENGLRALEICKRESPDILITDIRMPGLDGLELIEAVKKINALAKTIILSGYSDFAYLKKAIQFGAADYELKPLRVKKLISLIKKVREEILREKSTEENFQKYQQTYIAQFMQDICSGNIRDRNVILEGLEQYFGFQVKGFLFAVIFETQPAEPDGRGEADAYELLQPRLEKTLTEFSDMLCWKLDTRSTLLLVKTVNSMLYQKHMAVRLKNALEQLAVAIREEDRVSVNAGISLPGMIYEIPEMCLQARQALKDRFYSGRDGAYCFYPDRRQEKGFAAFPGHFRTNWPARLPAAKRRPLSPFLPAVLTKSQRARRILPRASWNAARSCCAC